MPQLALVMANYFSSLSKYCLSVYYGQTRKDGIMDKRKKEMRELAKIKPPKKPTSAYIRFYGEHYSLFQQQNPSIYIVI